MASFWEIQGQATKALDATVRDFYSVASSGTVSWETLATGTLRWSTMLADLVGTGAFIPEYNQEVTLKRNGSRFFWGHVTGVIQRGRSLTVTVSDAWWHAEHIPLSTLQTSNPGNTKERASYVFPTQSLSTSIAALVTRSIALGVPWQLGTVATTYSHPQITLAQMTVGAAIAELVRLCPDMMAWVDHTTTPPTINFTRRLSGLAVGSATAITLDARNLEDFSAAPRLEMKVEKVILPYVTRATDGSRIFAEQASGTVTNGRVQLLVVSGEELDTFLPNDKFDSVAIRTIKSNDAEATIRAWALDANSFLASLAAEYGSTWYSVVSGGSSSIRVATSSGEFFFLSGGSSTSVSTIGPEMVDSEGTTLSPSSWFAVRSTDRIPDWLAESGVLIKEGVFKMDVVSEVLFNTGDPMPTTDGITEYRKSCRTNITNAFANSGGTVSMRLSIYRAEIPVTFISTSYPALTTVYRPMDYAFISPPAGFAAGLLAAQNWVPYEGDARWSEQEAGSQRYSGRIIHFSNARTELATMGALVARETLDLESGTTTLDLGAPPRLSLANVVDRVRRTSQDNIDYL